MLVGRSKGMARGLGVFFLETRVAGTVNRWPIRLDGFGVGRGRSNDLIVDHESVSRERLEVDLGGGTVPVRALSRTTGLQAGDRRVEAAELGSDDWSVAGGVMRNLRRGTARTTADRAPSQLPSPLAAGWGVTRSQLYDTLDELGLSSCLRE